MTIQPQPTLSRILELLLISSLPLPILLPSPPPPTLLLPPTLVLLLLLLITTQSTLPRLLTSRIFNVYATTCTYFLWFLRLRSNCVDGQTGNPSQPNQVTVPTTSILPTSIHTLYTTLLTYLRPQGASMYNNVVKGDGNCSTNIFGVASEDGSWHSIALQATAIALYAMTIIAIAVAFFLTYWTPLTRLPDPRRVLATCRGDAARERTEEQTPHKAVSRVGLRVLRLAPTTDESPAGVEPTPSRKQRRLCVWYPADGRGRSVARALARGASPDLFATAFDFAAAAGVPSAVASFIELCAGRAELDAPPVPASAATRPLILLSHGNCGLPEVYAVFGEALAAAGCIVAGIVHSDRSAATDYQEAPDWKTDLAGTTAFRAAQMDIRVRDLEDARAAVLADPTFARLVGASSPAVLLGHSLGGCTVSAATKRLTWVSGAVALDSFQSRCLEQDECRVTPPGTPFVFVNSEYFQWDENVRRMHEYLSSFVRATEDTAIVKVNGSGHHSFNDFSQLAPMIAPKLPPYFMGANLDPIDCYAFSLDVILAVVDAVFEPNPEAAPISTTLKELTQRWSDIASWIPVEQQQRAASPSKRAQ